MLTRTFLRQHSRTALSKRGVVLSNRCLLTLAIETSCDDTCVAILEKHDPSPTGSASRKPTLLIHHHAKITSNNLEYRGIHPVVALTSHQQNLGNLVRSSLAHLPAFEDHIQHKVHQHEALAVSDQCGRRVYVKRPDIISVTRGPGMRSNLHTGLDTAKGLSIAWNVPLLAVNHMQAHALTPRLVSALSQAPGAYYSPRFPFLSLLVSGGHTILLHSKSLNDHTILAETSDIALGDCLDKIARAVLPASVLETSRSTSYGALLDAYAFPQVKSVEDYAYAPPRSRQEELARYRSSHGWSLEPPLASSKSGSRNRAMEFCFSGLASSCARVVANKTDIGEDERREIAREGMRLAFEHLATRVGFALDAMKTSDNPADTLAQIGTLVVSGGVAANKFLKHILTSYLAARNYTNISLSCPPLELCTDNAIMIGWTGIEMYEAGWESDLSCQAKRKWPLDPAVVGGILGVPGWKRRDGFVDA